MGNNQQTKEKLFVLEFTGLEIAIIKAGLQYYWLGDDFGYALWGTIPGATFGGSDLEYSARVGNIYKKLKKASKVKPDYGWGNIKRLAKLCKEYHKKAKKEGEEAEKRMNKDYLVHQMEMLLKASSRTGNYDWEKMIKEYEQEEKSNSQSKQTK